MHIVLDLQLGPDLEDFLFFFLFYFLFIFTTSVTRWQGYFGIFQTLPGQLKKWNKHPPEVHPTIYTVRRSSGPAAHSFTGPRRGSASAKALH